MAVLVRGKNIEITPALREYVEKNAAKLTRYFTDECDVQAVLAVEKEARVAEITCFVDGIVLRGVDANNDMYAAIDLVFDKIIRQIHKHKTRLAKRFKKAGAFRGTMPEMVADLAAPIEEEKIEVVRRKTIPTRPMDVEEAILQMNLVGHDFFMFFNSDTEMMNVVYRRKNGSYGLLEPER